MLSLEHGRTTLYQWDVGQRLIVDNPAITEVHFSNGAIKPAPVREVYERDGVRYADIPNELTRRTLDVHVYGCCADCVREAVVLRVLPREKPADYVYTPTEVKRYSDLDDRIKALESVPAPKPYTLPTATADTLGGVRVGEGLKVDGGKLKVKAEQYKLIETIVVNEDMAIERTAEPDGTPYNFKAVTMRIKKDVGVSYTTSFSLQAYFNLAATRSQPLYVPQSTKTNEELWCYAEVRQYKGLWERERALDWTIRNYTATPMLVKIPMYDNAVRNDETIVLLRSTGVALAGTTIEIWGVRA